MGCSSRNPGDQTEKARMAGLEAVECEGGVSFQTTHRFRLVGRSITATYCQPEPDADVILSATDDLTAEIVDVVQLFDDEREAFRSVHHGLEPELWEALAEQSEVPIEVDVWFRPEVTDEYPKEMLEAEPDLLVETTSKHETAVSSLADSLIQDFAHLPDVTLVSAVDGKDEYGVPIIRIQATAAALDQIGSDPRIWRILPVPINSGPGYETYYTTTTDTVLDFYNMDGTGVTVGILETGRPDLWTYLDGSLPGSCSDGTVSKKCHCAAGALDGHIRAVGGVVRTTSTTFGGMADQASVIMANTGGGCTSNGPDAVSSAWNWATSNGATVMVYAEGSDLTPLQGPQTSLDILMDYKATQPPYPTICAITHNVIGANTPTTIVKNRLRNGLVVGGAEEDLGSPPGLRSAVTWWTGALYTNPFNSSYGFELPHLAAPANGVDSAGPNGLNQSGTSIAAPQVAGIVAGLQEYRTALKFWPEAVMPILMASADEDIDGTELNLDDGIDDRDGAGLINAYYAMVVATNRVSSNNTPIVAAHDYGAIFSSTLPPSTYFPQTYWARVAAGKALRVSALVRSAPTCPANPSISSCSANPFPAFALMLYDGPTLVGISGNFSNNYQYIRHVNTSGAQKDYKIRLLMSAWNGVTATTFATAWSAS